MMCITISYYFKGPRGDTTTVSVIAFAANGCCNLINQRVSGSVPVLLLAD